MKKEYFEILIIILKIILMLLAVYVVPYIKKWLEENITSKQRQELLNFADVAIKIAEGYFKDRHKGKEKKKFVIDWLNKAGIKVEDSQIDTIIDTIVSWYNANGWDKNINSK